MRLIWCTDIHLDHCKHIDLFINDLKLVEPDRILLTGDISNAIWIVRHLKLLADELKLPIDFVLGNHDYYSTSGLAPEQMKITRYKVSNLCKNVENLNWLAESDPVKLTDDAALIGNGLWCDWRAGVKDKSNVWLNDYILIHDLCGSPYSDSDKKRIKKKVRKLAKEKSDNLLKSFKKAVDSGYKKVIIGTHVPPFHEGSFYNGKVQDNEWAPHFVCKIAGDKLKEEVSKNQNVDVTVLCGHTHGKGKADILTNLHVINGSATYRHPSYQAPIIL